MRTRIVRDNEAQQKLIPRHENKAQHEIETDDITSYDVISYDVMADVIPNDVMVQHAIIDDIMVQQ